MPTDLHLTAADRLAAHLPAQGQPVTGFEEPPVIDEHGNKLATCGVCVVVPTTSGDGALVKQASCPEHGRWS